MFKLTESDTPHYNVLSIKCPCGNEITFTDFGAPIICTQCACILPDALELRFRVSERIAYHLDDELFD